MNSRQQSPASGVFFPELLRYLCEREREFDSIPQERKLQLAEISEYIRARLSKSEVAKLNFICTHNSRRSHLSQLWAHIAADYFGLVGVETYSGGTEATAFNPRAVAAMQRSGVRISVEDSLASNPRYRVHTSESSAPQICFSKVFNDPPNPSSGYCAVMTCSQADDACPLVMGCDSRIPLRYDDPKVADDTEFEAQRYDERSAQICREMLFLMSLV
ncbi:MAG: protein-tyrosine-phosphatase [Planctomycetaceae bacterium]|nr:protein-tyrosine-phosphatase [Planctomycetaceae bacterium]